MMYSNIVKELVFHYIEHGILKYDFVYDIDMSLERIWGQNGPQKDQNVL